MRDPYGRIIDSLRISRNHSCNLRCFYCHNEGQYNGPREMTAEEIERLVRVASGLGVTNIKLTGGEPLLRNDVVDVVRRISSMVDEVSMTTNATLLASMAADLGDAGLQRVNISLDSIRPETYRRITRSGRMEETLEGLDAALDTGLTPIKINMVLLKGYNDGELPDMLSFAARKGVMLQLIEYEVPREETDGGLYKEHHIDLSVLETALDFSAERIGENPLHRRKRYRISRLPKAGPWEETPLDGTVEVELVRPMHNARFCSNCKRIRLTSSGKLKGCLFQKEGMVDTLGPLRAGASEEDLRTLFTDVVRNRHPYWKGSSPVDGDENVGSRIRASTSTRTRDG